MSEYISPGVIITALILIFISVWMVVGKLWQNKIIDNLTRRDQLFRYLNALGLVLASRGSHKTNGLYFKAYMGFIVTVKLKTAEKLAEYNKDVIKNLEKLSPDEINTKTIELINCIRVDYKIDKGIEKIWISDLTKNVIK